MQLPLEILIQYRTEEVVQRPPRPEWRQRQTCWNELWTVWKEKGRPGRRSLLCQRNTVRSRPGLTLTPSSSWRRRNMGERVTRFGTGLLSRQNRLLWTPQAYTTGVQTLCLRGQKLRIVIFCFVLFIVIFLFCSTCSTINKMFIKSLYQ